MLILQRWGLLLIAAAAAAALIMAGGCGPNISMEDVVNRRVGVEEVRKDLADGRDRRALLLDARPRREFEREHIEGARNLQFSDVPQKSTPDPALAGFRRLYVYGNDPGSAAAHALVKRMLEVGYRNVRWYGGGLDEWRRTGGPTTAPAAAPSGAGAAPAAN